MPLSAITPTTASTTNTGLFLTQKIESNTVLASMTLLQQLKLSAGYRFKNREITDPGDDLTWHENWLLLGAVVQPTSRALRLNVNFDDMVAKSAILGHDKQHIYTRGAQPFLPHSGAGNGYAGQVDQLALAANDYSAKNDDPLVNHQEHNHDFSFAAQIMPTDSVSLDLNFAHDDVFSETDLCYLSSLTAAGTVSTGTCVNGPAGTTPATTLVLGTGAYYLSCRELLLRLRQLCTNAVYQAVGRGQDE